MTLQEGKDEIDRELSAFVRTLPRSKSGDLQAMIKRLQNIQKGLDKFKKLTEPKINKILASISVENNEVESARKELESYLHNSVAKTMEKLIQK